jgi:predicted GNAT superfamily acetyltransferase
VHSSVDLQRRVWNYSEKQLVPDHIFIVASHAGGHALGAFINQELIGFALAFPGFWDGHSYLHSHMVAVAPEHHNRGVGRALKLAQLEDARKKNINCIKWTFDPLQIKNAHFNIARLGVIVREYLSDFYGRTSSPLHGGLPTDRLVAEWWINSLRVRRILSEGHLSFTRERRIGLPSDIAESLASDSHSGARIQLQLRSDFHRLFNAGYVVTGFEVTSKTASYVLEMLTSEDCQADRNQ